MFSKSITTKLIAASLLLTGSVAAEQVRVRVTIENLAPANGSVSTPTWVGFHDGISFDIYNGNTPANSLPIPGSVAVERLAEDGNTAPISADFSQLQPAGVQATLLDSEDPPLRPGEIFSQDFIVDSNNPNHRYFSYAAMLLPSNDFWYANGNPQAHQIFDENGNFVATDFIVSGDEDVLDAGTELNDEVPANTAFFGQQQPNTGVTTDADIEDVVAGNDDLERLGFKRPGEGGILDDFRFAMGDFVVPGYPLVKFSFEVAPLVEDNVRVSSRINAAQEIPTNDSQARGAARVQLVDSGTRLKLLGVFRGLDNVVAAHLHLGPEGENGPVVVNLLNDDFDGSGNVRFIAANATSDSLTGPLAGQPLDALVAAIQAGNVYINIHTEEFPAGEIRGQLGQRGPSLERGGNRLGR